MTEPRSFSADTDPRIHAMVIDRLRTMTPSEKARMVVKLNLACDALAIAGIRERHPEADADEVRMRLGVLRVGPELMMRAFAWDVREHGY
jgi:hypothetical protein